MKRRLRIGVSLLTLSVVFLFVGCQPQALQVPTEVPEAEQTTGEETQASTGATAKGPASQQQEYVLGVAMPFTGPLGSFGTGFREGIELAVEQMNGQLSAAGSNTSFSMVSADTEGTPDGAAKAVQTVVQTSGTEVVIGPLTTSEVLGAKQFADENEIVLVAPASSGLAGAIPNDFIYRPMHPPDSFAGLAFQKIAAARGYDNVVVLQVDDPFGNGLTKIFREGFEAAGGKEVVVVKYAPEPPSLSSEVSKISSEVARLSDAGETAVFCICFLGDAQKALQNAQVDPVLGEVDWLGIENLRTEELLADQAHAQFLADANFTTVSFAETQNPNTQPFIEAYTARFGHEPGPFTNYAYDSANIAMYAMVFAGNNGAGVKEVLPYIAAHYIGTQVQTYLDENGDQAIADLGIYQVAEDGSDFIQTGEFDGATGQVTLFNQ
ncbi:MAG: Leu/Ile/Val-binding protein [Anaerolineales bacterium]|nr:Leu/Ile/Val-binding protein [Anaerolineales bacterium]